MNAATVAHAQTMNRMNEAATLAEIASNLFLKAGADNPGRNMSDLRSMKQQCSIINCPDVELRIAKLLGFILALSK